MSARLGPCCEFNGLLCLKSEDLLMCRCGQTVCRECATEIISVDLCATAMDAAAQYVCPDCSYGD